MAEPLFIEVSPDMYDQLHQLAKSRGVWMTDLATELLEGAVRFETLADSALGVVPPD